MSIYVMYKASSLLLLVASLSALLLLTLVHFNRKVCVNCLQEHVTVVFAQKFHSVASSTQL